jgi:Epoxyqueuosine reductase QueH
VNWHHIQAVVYSHFTVDHFDEEQLQLKHYLPPTDKVLLHRYVRIDIDSITNRGSFLGFLGRCSIDKGTYSQQYKPSALYCILFSCCAPCSGSMIKELVDQGIDVTILWYNPNIQPKQVRHRQRDINDGADSHTHRCADNHRRTAYRWTEKKSQTD